MTPPTLASLDRARTGTGVRRSDHAANEGLDAAAVWSSVSGTLVDEAGPEPQHSSVPRGREAPPTEQAPFDLPAFLQVLPKAGNAVAVAAGREPTMAAALRRLPAGSSSEEPPIASRPSLRHEGAAFDLPSFLVKAADTAKGAVPPEPVARLRSGTQSGTVAALRGALQSLLPSRQTAAGAESTPTAGQAPLPGITAVGPVSGAAHNAALLMVPPMPAPVTADPAAASTPTDLGSGVLPAPVGTEAWHDHLSAQLSLMAAPDREVEAVMKLAPEELGELEIRVLVRDGEASLQFAAASAEARQAIEVAQPRLRELFASQGMGILNFSVFSSLGGDSHPSSREEGASKRSSGMRGPVDTELQVRVAARDSQGIVDLYA